MILLHYLTRLFYIFLLILSRAKMAKKRPSRIESSPLSPVSLASAETVGTLPQLTYRFLSCWGAAAAIGGTCLGRLSGSDTRQRKVMYSLTHSLTYHYVRYMYLVILGMYLCKEGGRGNCACAAACAAATAVVRSGQVRSGTCRYNRLC